MDFQSVLRRHNDSIPYYFSSPGHFELRCTKWNYPLPPIVLQSIPQNTSICTEKATNLLHCTHEVAVELDKENIQVIRMLY